MWCDTSKPTPDLEVLVNNAGFGTKGLFLRSRHRAARSRCTACTSWPRCGCLTRRCGEWCAQRKGAVINVSSVAAFLIGAGSASYGATKAWMNAFTEALDAELRAVGSPVKVQALCPGFTITEFHDTIGHGSLRWFPGGCGFPPITWSILRSGRCRRQGDRHHGLAVQAFCDDPDGCFRALVRKSAQASGRRMKRLVRISACRFGAIRSRFSLLNVLITPINMLLLPARLLYSVF